MKFSRVIKKRVYARFLKICKIATVVVAFNFLAESAVVKVLKDQILGEEIEKSSTDYVDYFYGDVEALLEERLEKDRMTPFFINGALA